MSLIYVFTAMTMEGQVIRKISGPNKLVPINSGMGPKNAQREAEVALGVRDGTPMREKPDAVVVIGLCGGLTSSLPEGRIVAYTECRSTEPASPVLECSQAIVGRLMPLLGSANIPFNRVVGITSPRFAIKPQEKRALAERGASVVDMETYAIMAAALTVGVPAVALRVVADAVDRELPDFNRALNDAGGLDGCKALKVVLGSPLKTVRLLLANKRAMQHLNKALEIVLASDCFK